MCNLVFPVTATLKSYFHPFTPSGMNGKVDKVRAFLTVASYFTIIIPRNWPAAAASRA